MTYVLPILLLFVGLALGGGAAFAFLRAKSLHAFEQGQTSARAELAAMTERLAGRDATIDDLRSRLQQKELALGGLQDQAAAERAKCVQLATALGEERKQAQEKLALLEDAKRALSDAFKALAADALKSSNSSFLELAKTQLEKYQESAKGDLDKRQTAIDELVKPVKESLTKVDAKLQEIEKSRIESFTSLASQVKSLTETQTELRHETAHLVQALRRPQVRGRWGEIQLKRVVEMAGMLDHCDFFEQQQTTDCEGGQLRPDLVIRLPGQRSIVVDSKAPLEAYLAAIEATDDETRTARLKDHARQVRNHVTALGRKSYYEQFERSPDFVVLFLPGEVFYNAALEQDPSLIEMAVNERVLITTPTSLIALLRAAAYGWGQEQLAENAKQISELGQELYKRLSDLSKHIARVGKALDAATDAYNKAVGSLETRVLVSARRFKELGAASPAVEIELLVPVDAVPRRLQAPELLGLSDGQATGPDAS